MFQGHPVAGGNGVLNPLPPSREECDQSEKTARPFKDIGGIAGLQVETPGTIQHY